MLKLLVSIGLIFAVLFSQPQQVGMLTGNVFYVHSNEKIFQASVSIHSLDLQTVTNENGLFVFHNIPYGEYILTISFADYSTQNIPIIINKEQTTIATIYLEPNRVFEEVNTIISLSDDELLDDEILSASAPLLQATRDVFLRRAAFDFGQAFFRVRGYDSQNSKVLFNGIEMNKLINGRPQWNNWGGLNDVIRNQQFSNGLAVSDYSFGGVLGTTNIDNRPSGLRSGTRFTASASNRSYTGRLMATHTSKTTKNGLTYTFSGSRRWAKQGYIEGTLYDAYSLYGALEYQLNTKHSLLATAIFASNRRGKSSAITQEVFNLKGNTYNPYWGMQNGKIRTTRERQNTEPIFMLHHFYNTKNLTIVSGIAYQFGKTKNSRLGYFNAPNPDPTYYRYLPSYYINSSIGANFISANTARDAFLEQPQVNWSKIYQANTNKQAKYVLYDDVNNDQQWTFNSIASFTPTNKLTFNLGTSFKNLNTQNYAQIVDLFGATFHEDSDPFTVTKNDVNGSLQKHESDLFSYNYQLTTSQFKSFLQSEYTADKFNFFVAVKFQNLIIQRKGLFKNERFLENSLGKSTAVNFSTYSFKGGGQYMLTGRHVFQVNTAYLQRPATLQNTFINPRENNQIVPNLNNETISSFDANYYLRMPKITGRLTGFYTRFQDQTDINYFYVDSGVGSQFVNEVISNMDHLHKGVELGLELQLSSAVKLTGAASIAQYTYANNPEVAINYIPDVDDSDISFNPSYTHTNLGAANLKDYKLAQGPQKAFSLGVEYRDPKYWWLGVTANYMANNYNAVSALARTQSFYLDPETGAPFANATNENVTQLLKQKPLDNFYLLNLIGGKSWLKKGKYISIFGSINNAFDAVFRTGGYEQSRNGNYGQMQHDMQSGTPSFAPKFWYGNGRTYFINVAYSF